MLAWFFGKADMPTLQWFGRKEVVLATERAPFRLLEHDPAFPSGSSMSKICSTKEATQCALRRSHIMAGDRRLCGVTAIHGKAQTHV